MIYRIHNPTTGHGFDPVETEYPSAWITAKAIEAGFDPEGYIWEPSAYVEPAPTTPDPSIRLASDKAFGAEIVDSFLSASKAANLGLYETEILDDMLDKVERYLLRGSIGVAKEALELVEPNQLFPAQAKAYYPQISPNQYVLKLLRIAAQKKGGEMFGGVREES